MPQWVKGFLRLSVVLYVVAWLAVSIFIVVMNANDLWLMKKHFNPYLGYPATPSKDDWTVYTASQDFLSRSDADRLIIAEGFFQKEKQLAIDLFFDTEELHAWFLKTAVMPVSQAPIEQYHDYSGVRRGEPPLSYRDFITSVSRPSIRLTKIFFSFTTLRLSLLATLVLIAIILLIFLPLRWVIRGFKHPAKS